MPRYYSLLYRLLGTSVLLLAGSRLLAQTVRQEHVPALPAAATITLIFAPAAVPSERLSLGGTRAMSISGEQLVYVDNGRVRPLRRHYTQPDTFRLAPEREIIVVQHRYDVIKSADFLVHRGDTVRFTYERGYPIATMLNRPTASFEVNYETAVRPLLWPGQPYSAQERYDNQLAFIDWEQGAPTIRPQATRVKRVSDSLLTRTLPRELRLLDSLRRSASLPAAAYAYFAAKAESRLRYQALTEGRLPYEQAAEQVAAYVPGPFSYLTDGFYTSFVRSVAFVYFIQKTPLLSLGPGRVINDYRRAYDTLAQSSLFAPTYKIPLLAEQLRNIAEVFPQADLQRYFTKFKATTPDTALVGYLTRTYVLNLNKLRSESAQVYLMKPNKKKVTLAQVLAECRGRKVYVDFWASWCGPCRQAMPASRQLRERYKRAVFLYLSTDQNFEAWQAAAKQEKLEYYKYSYVVVNPQAAAYLRALRIRTIPRYLLFDETGKLVHKNAPGPAGTELARLLIAK